MRKISKSIIFVCIILMILIVCTLPCVAATPNCTITVCLEDNEKRQIDGLEVFICKIADINGSDYYPSSGFENSGISIAGIVNSPSAGNAEILFEYVTENDIPCLSATSASGMAEFASVDKGIWLVYCKHGGEYSFNPYIVFLPYSANGKPCYEVTSAPKTEKNTLNNKSVYVVKKWEDKNNAAGKRPHSVTVDLKLDGKIVDTATLSEGNGWSYTFSNLPNIEKCSVSEKAVEHYSAEYSGDSENGFIITNTYNGEKLPQTGQLWWPVAIIAVVGVAFVLLGIIELGAGKNAKKHK